MWRLIQYLGWTELQMMILLNLLIYSKMWLIHVVIVSYYFRSIGKDSGWGILNVIKESWQEKGSKLDIFWALDGWEWKKWRKIEINRMKTMSKLDIFQWWLRMKENENQSGLQFFLSRQRDRKRDKKRQLSYNDKIMW